jgi:peroxiredoxin
MAEIPAINYLFNKYSSDIDFIGITCDNQDKLKEYQNKYNSKIILVPSQGDGIKQSWLYRIFSVNGKALAIPTVYFINKEKSIKDILEGAEEEFHPQQYGITDPKVKEITKAEADSANIATIEPLIQRLINNK